MPESNEDVAEVSQRIEMHDNHIQKGTKDTLFTVLFLTWRLTLIQDGLSHARQKVSKELIGDPHG